MRSEMKWGGRESNGTNREREREMEMESRESPDEGVEMMGWQFPSTRLFFRAVKHIVRHCLKCPG